MSEQKGFYNYTEQEIEYALETNYMPYAMLVIISRALPSVYDGLKPSHRKLLYMMYLMNLLKGKRTKSANIVGQTMKLNPHGDGAIYETMVRLTKDNGSLLVPLVDSKGNFGKVYSRDMAYAASRYTEAKLAQITEELFKNIDDDTVDFNDNYDGTMKEPSVLPTTFPHILVNPNQGIAVGMASNICSFNLSEVCDATIGLLDDEDMEVRLIPDFPTGGEYIYSEKDLRAINTTGRGSVVVRSKYEYIKEYNCIEISEIPYTTTVEAIMDKIEELVKLGKIKEISDIRDETDLKGLKLTIDLKRGTNPEQLMTKLFQMTPLRDTFGCNFNVLVQDDNGKIWPKILGTKAILKEWMKFRIKTVKRQIAFELNAIDAKVHILEGFKKIIVDLDKAIQLIRSSKNKTEAYGKLMEYFEITETQAKAIGDINLINLNEEYLQDKISELEKLLKTQKKLNKILTKDEFVKEIIKEQLEKVKKNYGQERLTSIVHDDTAFISSKLVVEEPCTVVLTKEGYVKVNNKYNANQRLKDGDEIESVTQTTNLSTILIFTNLCNCYKVYVSDLEMVLPSAMGTYLPSLVQMEKDEQIISVQLVDKEYSGNLVNVYANNRMSKVKIASFKTETKRSCLKNSLGLEAPLIAQFKLQDDEHIDLFIQGEYGKSYLVNTSQVKAKTSKNTIGDVLVKREKDYTVQAAVELSKLKENLELIKGADRYQINFDREDTTNEIVKASCVAVITKDNEIGVFEHLSDIDETNIKETKEVDSYGAFLVFTNQRSCYKVYIEDMNFNSDVTHISEYVTLDEDEEILFTQVVNGDYEGNLINIYENNKLAKVSLTAFMTTSNSTRLKNSLSAESKLINQFTIMEDVEIFVQSTINKVLIVSTEQFNPKATRSTAGDSLIKSKEGSVVKRSLPINDMDLSNVESLDYYRLNRGGTGYYKKKTDIFFPNEVEEDGEEEIEQMILE